MFNSALTLALGCFAAFAICSIGICGETTLQVPAAPKPLPHGLNVLVIGDSNTEIGHITGELARRFEQEYGYLGSGYHSLNKTIGMGQGYLPYLAIENVGEWESYTMLWPTAAPKPYIAPEGACVRSSTPGAHTDVSFYGDGIDLYWLGEPVGGEFVVLIDGQPKAKVSTRAGKRVVKRTRISDLACGWHTLEARVTSGTVVLEGVDARVDSGSGSRRAVVHKWGKGWAATSDHLDVDEDVFTSAIRLVDPDVVVILLGTNDHNLRGANRDQFADNITALVSRVRIGAPKARVLLVSTFQINGTWTNLALKDYVEAFPEIARANRAYYWDMSTWFGPFEAANKQGWFMEDGIHASQKGGAHIAEQLYGEVLKVAASDRYACPAQGKEHLRRVGCELRTGSVPAASAWWAADGPVTLDKDQRVVSICDLSGHGADAFARWKGCRPAYVEHAAGDRPVIRFDAGEAQYLSFPDNLTGRTFVVALRGRGILFGHPYFNTRPFHPGVADPGRILDRTYASPSLTGGKAYVDGVACAPSDVTFPNQELRVITLVATGPVEVKYLGWGGSWNCNQHFAGDIAEVLVYDRALRDAERVAVEGYLADKYGTGKSPAISK